MLDLPRNGLPKRCLLGFRLRLRQQRSGNLKHAEADQQPSLDSTALLLIEQYEGGRCQHAPTHEIEREMSRHRQQLDETEFVARHDAIAQYSQPCTRQQIRHFLAQTQCSWQDKQGRGGKVVKYAMYVCWNGSLHISSLVNEVHTGPHHQMAGSIQTAGQVRKAHVCHLPRIIAVLSYSFCD